MIVLPIILWLLCSIICYQILKSKGYPNDTCLNNGIIGFFLGIIWVVVVLCKSNYETSSQDVTKEIMRYKELLNVGIISEEEYQAKKAQLMKLI